MFRLEIDTVHPCRPSRRERSYKGRLLQTMVLNCCATRAECLAEVASYRDSMEGCTILTARMWEGDAFEANLRTWKSGQVAGSEALDAAQIEALPTPAPLPPMVEDAPIPEPTLEELGQGAFTL